MDYCYYCHAACGPGGFCDESCKVNYDKDMEAWHQEIMEDMATKQGRQGRGFLEFDISDDDEIIG